MIGGGDMFITMVSSLAVPTSKIVDAGTHLRFPLPATGGMGANCNG
jgi:hypothetical protein